MSIDSIGVTQVIAQVLDLSLKRAELASQNIAGAAIPGFVAKRVDEQAFLNQLRQLSNDPVAQPAALDHMTLREIETDHAVSEDSEVAELVAANTDYQALVETLNKHMSLMRLAITSRA